MKTNTLNITGILITLLFSVVLTSAQAPKGFNYQAIARNLAGDPLPNQNISLKFSILDSSASGPVLYQETWSVVSNQFGLFSAVIGGGVVVSGSMDSLRLGTG